MITDSEELVTRSFLGGSASPKMPVRLGTDAKAVAEDARWSQRIGRICQRVGHNAFHLRRIGFSENSLDQSRNKNVLELFQRFS